MAEEAQAGEDISKELRFGGRDHVSILFRTLRFGMHRCRLVPCLMGALTILLVLFGTNRIELHKVAPRWLHGLLEDTFMNAAFYYRQQHPLFEAAAKSFKLDWVFAQTVGFDSMDMTYVQMIELRLRAMGKVLNETGRDDFKVEKDKLAMLDFFARNDIHSPRVLERWSTLEELVADIRSLAFLETTEKWPVFLKARHFHGGAGGGSGASFGVRRVKSLKWAEEHKEELITWATQTFGMHADDKFRPWREAGNLLTDTVTPGVYLQAPVSPSCMTPDLCSLLEFKVEVLWGRAFVALLTDKANFAVTRGSGGLFEYRNTEGALSALSIDKVVPRSWRGNSPWHEFAIREGLLACAWEQAEKVARTIGIDAVRVDVFVMAARPKDCLVNEISLSSGLPIYAYGRYLARLWAEPHMKKWYTVVGNASAKPVYQRVGEPS